MKDWRVIAVLGLLLILVAAYITSGLANGWGETAAAISRKVDLLIGAGR